VSVLVGVNVKAGVDVNASVSVAVGGMELAVGPCNCKLQARMASRQTR